MRWYWGVLYSRCVSKTFIWLFYPASIWQRFIVISSNCQYYRWLLGYHTFVMNVIQSWLYSCSVNIRLWPMWYWSPVLSRLCNFPYVSHVNHTASSWLHIIRVGLLSEERTYSTICTDWHHTQSGYTVITTADFPMMKPTNPLCTCTVTTASGYLVGWTRCFVSRSFDWNCDYWYETS
jgi:hypothetical protein